MSTESFTICNTCILFIHVSTVLCIVLNKETFHIRLFLCEMKNSDNDERTIYLFLKVYHKRSVGIC